MSEKSEWYCDHCGCYFPAKSWDDVCECGARVDASLGWAAMPDGHHWSSPGAPYCTTCVLQPS